MFSTAPVIGAIEMFGIRSSGFFSRRFSIFFCTSGFSLRSFSQPRQFNMKFSFFLTPPIPGSSPLQPLPLQILQNLHLKLFPVDTIENYSENSPVFKHKRNFKKFLKLKRWSLKNEILKMKKRCRKIEMKIFRHCGPGTESRRSNPFYRIS